MPAPTSEGSCQQGSAADCYEVAAALIAGSEGELERDRGVPFLERACELGHGRGCLELGELHSNGDLISTDWNRSRELRLRACELGEADGCDVAATASPGQQPTDDAERERLLARAADLRRPACRRGDPEACHGLATQTLTGSGVERDHEAAALMQARAAEGFSSRCEQGDSQACLSVADVLNGPSIDETSRRSAAWQRGCDLGDALACRRLATELLYGGAPDSRRAQTLLVRESVLLRERCDEGWQQACAKLLRWSRGVLDEQELAWTLRRQREVLQAQCERGRLVSCAAMAETLLTAETPDVPRAVDLLDRSCERGEPGSCATLAARLETGFGMDPDPPRARSLWHRACEAGRALACTNERALARWIERGERPTGPRERAVSEVARDILNEQRPASRSQFGFPLELAIADSECHPGEGLDRDGSEGEATQDDCGSTRQITSQRALRREMSRLLTDYRERAGTVTGERWICDEACCSTHYADYSDLSSRSHGQLELVRICTASDEVHAPVVRIELVLH